MPAAAGGTLDLIFLIAPTTAQLCSIATGISKNS